MRTPKLIVLGLVPLLLTVASCGGGGGGGGGTGTSSGSGSGQPATSTIANVATMTVESDPSGTSVDIPYITVTICNPNNTAQCQTFDHILVDTGSYGFRILADATDTSGNPFSLTLPSESNASGAPVAECAQFVDGYSWGTVATADVQISGESATGVPIQVIGDPTVSGDASFPQVPVGCSSTGTGRDSVATFAANGILGVGPFAPDCGQSCANTTSNGFYYTCPSSGGCQQAALAVAEQITDPVVDFQTDNNGVIIELPSIAPDGAATASGSLVFGIGTEGNNTMSGQTVLSANSNGDISTAFNGQQLQYSLLDTGSNAYYFNDNSIQACLNVTGGWFCPTSTLSLNATNYAVNASGVQTGVSSKVTFDVGNAEALLANNNSAYDDIAASSGDQSAYCPNGASNCSFDFGLPFFFGRNVYVAIAGENTSAGMGPFFAY